MRYGPFSQRRSQFVRKKELEKKWHKEKQLAPEPRHTATTLPLPPLVAPILSQLYTPNNDTIVHHPEIQTLETNPANRTIAETLPCQTNPANHTIAETQPYLPCQTYSHL